MIEIFHNPRCTKSRQAVQLLEEKGVDFSIVDYIKQPLTVEKLTKTITQLGIKPQELLRKNEAVFKEQFKGKELSDQQWIEAMIEFPKLMERPIAIKDNKAVIGRPTEKVEELFN